MRRRDFFRAAGAVGVGSTVLGSAPSRLVATTDDLNKLPEPSSGLVEHCKRILEQNLLKSGETFVLASSFSYDQDYILAMLTAAGEIGAAGAHMAVFPKINAQEMESNLSPFHWEAYAMADLLISTGCPEEISATQKT